MTTNGARTSARTRSAGFSLPALLLGVALATACAPHDPNPYLGKWNGKFAVTEAGKEQGRELARNDLTGYLQIYGTGDKFELYLTGEQETVKATGTWTAKGGRMTLKVLDLQIDDAGGEVKRRMDKKYIPPDDLRAAYQGTLVLSLSKDRQRLAGLQMAIGSLVGQHEFTKVSNRYTY